MRFEEAPPTSNEKNDNEKECTFYEVGEVVTKRLFWLVKGKELKE